MFVGAVQGGEQLFVHSLESSNYSDPSECGWGLVGEQGIGAELLTASRQRSFMVIISFVYLRFLLFGACSVLFIFVVLVALFLLFYCVLL